MNENYNNDANNNGRNLYALLTSLEQQVSTLKEQYGDTSTLSPEEFDTYISKKASLIQKIDLVEKCIKIGIIKKVDSMSIDELQNIALQSLSIVSEGINPDEFISEYNRLNQYVKEYQEDLQRRRSILEELTFIVEGPLDVLVDKNGKPRSDFIVSEDDAKLLKKQAKMSRKFGNRRIEVKVPMYYFSDEELDGMGYKKAGNLLLKGLAVKTPDDYVLKEGEPYPENPFQHFTITSTAEASRKLSSRYSIYDAREAQQDISRMQVVLPEIQLKKRLLTDKNYLKEYVKKLLVDPYFVEQYISSVGKINDASIEMQYLYSHEITNLSEQDFANLMEIIESTSIENLQKMFDSPEKIDMYITLINEIKRKITRKFPGIWLKPENTTDEINEIINSDSNTFRAKFPVGCQVYPEFITEQDLQLLEQNKTIIKEVNGVNIPFKLAVSRYKETSFYYDEVRQQRPEFAEKLHEVIGEYRKAISIDYPKQLEKIAECNRKLEALERLKSEYGQPSMQESTLHAKPRH